MATKQIPEEIHKAPKFENVEEQTSKSNSDVIELQDEETKSAAAAVVVVPNFDLAKTAASVNYREPIKTDRPKNVYIELIDGSYWLWYNTEKSTEVGIKRNFVTDEMTQVKSEFGYDCNIPATKANIELVKEMSFAGTQYMYKDSVRRTVVELDKFVLEAKL